MILKQLAGCTGGPCPGVFQTEQNSFVMQGRFLPSSVLEQLHLASDETAVELPAEVVLEFIAKLQGSMIPESSCPIFNEKNT